MRTIAIAGNPNSGKTTLFNELTGANQKVGNWPGVTVERKEGLYLKDNTINLVDLPGIYSLSPYTPEEVVAREYLVNDNPDLIINIIDSTSLERSLYLTTQLLEMNIPMILALNMTDILEDDLDLVELSQRLDSPVVEISALKKTGIDELMLLAKKHNKIAQPLNIFEKPINTAINNIEEIVCDRDCEHLDWYSLKLLEEDVKIQQQFNLSSDEIDKITKNTKKIEKEYDEDIRGVIANQRYDFITEIRDQIIINSNENKRSTTEKLDMILTNKYLALPIFALIMFLIYYFTVSSIGGAITDFIEEVIFPEWIQAPIADFLIKNQVSVPLQSLIIDGLIGGVGAVVTFVPQIMILFFFIAILEDCGYMSRIAFILDRIFRFFGLSGKSVIPMIIGSGCSVPAIMATRTIENESDRKITVMLTPFVICSAKLPIFVLLINLFFPSNPFIMTALYFLGIIVLLISGYFLKKLKIFEDNETPFIMELPNYRWPQFKTVVQESFNKGLSFLKNAGSIIFIASGIVWFLSSFNFKLQFVDAQVSMLAAIGKVIAPIFIPLGFGSWEATVATFTGFLAKETVISTLSILGASVNMGLDQFVLSLFTPASALSFMVFTIFAAPCFAAIAATKRELGTWKATLQTIAFQTGVAYVLALITFQIARIIL